MITQPYYTQKAELPSDSKHKEGTTYYLQLRQTSETRHCTSELVAHDLKYRQRSEVLDVRRKSAANALIANLNPGHPPISTLDLLPRTGIRV